MNSERVQKNVYPGQGTIIDGQQQYWQRRLGELNFSLSRIPSTILSDSATRSAETIFPPYPIYISYTSGLGYRKGHFYFSWSLTVLVYTEIAMSILAKIRAAVTPPVTGFLAYLITFGLTLYSSSALSHPLEYHLEPLDDRAIERVLTSFERLSARLQHAGVEQTARLPDNALGITAVVWTMEEAVARLDEARAVESPTLLQALKAAGYEDSPYIVAEWKIEAERVWEAYEVLNGNFRTGTIGSEMAALEREANQLTEEQLARKEAALLRKASMVQTTARDVSKIAPYRGRLDRLSRKLGN